MSFSPSINPILLKAFMEGLELDPDLKISEWGDHYRILPTESSSEAGQYRIGRMPYLREPADELSPQSVASEVTVVKGIQLGLTELGNNALFCYSHLYRCPMLQILPTETATRTHATSKTWPSIEASPVLKNIIRPRKTTDGSSITNIVFNGGSITLAWSNSATSFASMSRRVVVCDDVDRWPLTIEGGDPLDLAKNRTEAFPNNKKIYYNSSPGEKHRSKIWPKYNNSSMGVYTMKCPHCGEDVVFEKDGFVFEKDENYQLIGNVVFVCSNNGCIIEEYMKFEMMEEEKGARYVHAFPERIKHRGFRIPSYYSPFKTWNEIFQEYLEAYKDMVIRKDTTKMASWTNTKDANVWEETIVKLDVNEFLNRHEDYAADVPSGAFILTAGVDTQDDRLECEVVGWGKYGESWSIGKFILEGDPKYQRVWEKLDKILQSTFRHESGIDMKIMGMGVDSGGHRTEFVYAYCKPRIEQNVFCLKGDNAVETPILKTSNSKASKGAFRLYMIGVNSAKDVVYGHLTTKEVGPGYMHFPRKPEYNEEHFKQLTGEKKDKTTGRWSKFRTRNEALDIRVYSMAALKILENQYYPNGIDWDDIEMEFNARVEAELNNIKQAEKESVEHNSFSDWRDMY